MIMGNHDSKTYSYECYEPGTVIACVWQPTDRVICFYINGRNQGVAFYDVPDSGLLPAFDIFDSNCQFELL